MTPSAKGASGDACATKAELIEQVVLLKSRVKELEQDITDRQQAEAALPENESRFRAIIDQLPVSFSLKDADDRYLMVNRKFRDWFAANDEAVAGKSTRDLYDDVFARQLIDSDKRVRQTGEVIVQEILQPFADGAMHPTQVTKFPIELMGEQAMLVGTIAVDITQIKEMGKELRESEERFRTLVEHTRGIAYRCVLDEAWTMLYIGGAVEEITSYPQSDFHNNAVRSFGSIIHPDDAGPVASEVEQAIAAHRDFRLEYRIVRRDGSFRWVLSNGQPILDPESGLKWIDGTLFDITERRQVEQEMANKEVQLRMVLDNMPGAIVAVDKDLNLVLVNEQ